MAKGDYNRTPKHIEEKIIDLYVVEEYGSITIGRMLNISKSCVLRILKRNNISRRSISSSGKKLFEKGYTHPMKGKKLSEEHKKILSKARKDITIWNKGKTKKDDSRIKGGRISKGAFYDVNSGYMLIWKDNKLQKYHRYIYELNYGIIPKGFDIHHIDGDKLNNNIQNLELLTKSQHTKRHWDEGKSHSKRKVLN